LAEFPIRLCSGVVHLRVLSRSAHAKFSNCGQGAIDWEMDGPSKKRDRCFGLEELRDCFKAIAPELIRFPSLDPDRLRTRIEQFIERHESTSESNQ
jgi:hypothetical protein